MEMAGAWRTRLTLTSLPLSPPIWQSTPLDDAAGTAGRLPVRTQALQQWQRWSSEAAAERAVPLQQRVGMRRYRRRLHLTLAQGTDAHRSRNFVHRRVGAAASGEYDHIHRDQYGSAWIYYTPPGFDVIKFNYLCTTLRTTVIIVIIVRIMRRGEASHGDSLRVSLAAPKTATLTFSIRPWSGLSSPAPLASINNHQPHPDILYSGNGLDRPGQRQLHVEPLHILQTTPHPDHRAQHPNIPIHSPCPSAKPGRPILNRAARLPEISRVHAGWEEFRSHPAVARQRPRYPSCDLPRTSSPRTLTRPTPVLNNKTSRSTPSSEVCYSQIGRHHLQGEEMVCLHHHPRAPRLAFSVLADSCSHAEPWSSRCATKDTRVCWCWSYRQQRNSSLSVEAVFF
jgi:hypothetical protein